MVLVGGADISVHLSIPVASSRSARGFHDHFVNRSVHSSPQYGSMVINEVQGGAARELDNVQTDQPLLIASWPLHHRKLARPPFLVSIHRMLLLSRLGILHRSDCTPFHDPYG